MTIKPIDVEKDLRTDRLIEFLKISDGQEHAIKDEENTWVRNYWAFYAAAATLGLLLGRVAVSDRAHEVLSEHTWVGAIVFASLILITGIATCEFQRQLLMMRWTYYGVRDRLLRIQRLLQTDKPEPWGGIEIVPYETRLLSEIRTNHKLYEQMTSPQATFLARLRHMLFGHMIVSAVVSGTVVVSIGLYESIAVMLLGLASAVVCQTVQGNLLRRDSEKFMCWGLDPESAEYRNVLRAAIQSKGKGKHF